MNRFLKISFVLFIASFILIAFSTKPGLAYFGDTLPTEHCRDAWLRGDAAYDGQIDIADAVFMINYLFLAGPAPKCLEHADFNGDGRIDVADPVAILKYLLSRNFTPPDPEGPGIDDPPQLWYKFLEVDEDGTIPIPNKLYLGNLDTGEPLDIRACSIMESTRGLIVFEAQWEPNNGMGEDFSGKNLALDPLEISIEQPLFNDSLSESYELKITCWDGGGQEETIEFGFTGKPTKKPEAFCHYGDGWSDQCCQSREDNSFYCEQDLDYYGPEVPMCKVKVCCPDGAGSENCFLTNDLDYYIQEGCRLIEGIGDYFADFSNCCPAGADCYEANPPLGGGGTSYPYGECRVGQLTILMPEAGADDYIKNELGFEKTPALTDKKYPPGISFLGPWEGTKEIGSDPNKVQAPSVGDNKDPDKVIYQVGYGFIVYAKLDPESNPDLCPEHQFAQATQMFGTGSKKWEGKATFKEAARDDHIWGEDDLLYNRKIADYEERLFSGSKEVYENSVVTEIKDPVKACAIDSKQWCDDAYAKPLSDKVHIPGDPSNNIPARIVWKDMPGAKTPADLSSKTISLQGRAVQSAKFSFTDIVEDSDGTHRWFCTLKNIEMKSKGEKATRYNKFDFAEPACSCKEQTLEGDKWKDVRVTQCGQI